MCLSVSEQQKRNFSPFRHDSLREVLQFCFELIGEIHEGRVRPRFAGFWQFGKRRLKSK